MGTVAKLVGSRLSIHCPACGVLHEVPVSPEGWGWNQSLLSPTLTPSVKVTDREWISESSYTEKICHFFITEGRIHYCSDSTHTKKGQILALPSI